MDADRTGNGCLGAQLPFEETWVPEVSKNYGQQGEAEAAEAGED